MKAVLGCLLAAGGLHAETVRIEGGFGHQGSGWLFGSRKDQSCWIALPWHLVEGASESGRRFTQERSRGSRMTAIWMIWPLRASP